MAQNKLYGSHNLGTRDIQWASDKMSNFEARLVLVNDNRTRFVNQLLESKQNWLQPWAMSAYEAKNENN